MIDGKIENLSDVARLPILTKKQIQESGAAMTAQIVPESKRLRNQTGGSTGSPLQFWVDVERFSSRLASTVRHNEWAGYRPGDWTTYLWGARLDLSTKKTFTAGPRNYWLDRRLELNTSNIDEQDWSRFIERIRKYRPQVMIAYASAAVEFAHEVTRRNEPLTFRSIITTAEVLTLAQRQLLEQTFSGKVFNRYGCREVSVIASECEFHHMHVNADALLLEIEPDRGLPLGTGRVLVTDLLNRSMPLIRYDIGDAARWRTDQACACGRTLPLIENIEGRTTDFLVMPDGRIISGPALTLVVADMAQVSQVQFVQFSRTEVMLKVVPGRAYGEETRAELRRRLSLYLKGSVELNIQEVANIPTEASGKYRFVVNEVAARMAQV